MNKKVLIFGLTLLVALSFNSSCKEEVVKQEEEPVRNITDISYSAFGQEQALHPFEKDSILYVVLPSSWTADSLYYIDSIQSDGQVRILHSELPSIFISTESGSMEAVDNSADKSVKEKGYIRIVNADGSVEYEGKLKHIKGRGHMSWKAAKKPYNIKLNDKTQLFGFRTSRNYCLLANADDCSSIRNYLTYHFARDLGIPYSVGIQPVVLWLNGNYQGIYTLTEKVGAGKAGANLKVQKDSIDGGVLFENIQFSEKPKQRMQSVNGEYFGLKDPDMVNQIQLEHIQSMYQELEKALEATDGINPVTGKCYSDYLDVSSFAKYYLLQEVFANCDAYYGSYYFYKDANEIDSLFYAGPLWDMDKSMFLNGKRVNKCPNALYVRSCNFIFYRNLCNQQLFGDTVKTLYLNDFLPLLRTYFDSKLDSLSEVISKDVSINNVKWESKLTAEEDLEDIKVFMHQRINFMERLFADDSTRFCKVTVYRAPQGAYINPAVYYIEVGDTISIREEKTSFDGYNYLGCFDDSGNLFDFRNPIYEDTQLFMRWEYTSWIKRVKADVDEFRVNFGAWRRSLLE